MLSLIKFENTDYILRIIAHKLKELTFFLFRLLIKIIKKILTIIYMIFNKYINMYKIIKLYSKY